MPRPKHPQSVTGPSPTPDITADITGPSVVSAQAMAALQTAITVAQGSLDAAQHVLDAATSDYAATEGAYATAQTLSSSADALAASTKAAAEAAAAKLMVALHQTHADQAITTFGAVTGNPGASPGGNLLDRLAAATKLSDLNGPIDTLAKQAASTAHRAEKASSEAAKDRAALSAIPLGQKRAALDDAQSALDQAKASLDAAMQAMLTASGGVGPGLGFAAGFANSLNLAPGTWVDPVRGPITDVFGPRPSRPAGTPVFHPGVDIGAACLAVIVAAADGTVDYAGPYGGYGNFILIDHGDGVQTAYGHISAGTFMVSAGERVTAGQPIARVGSTGESTGCHLHIEVRVNGTPIDPMPFFASRGVILGQ